MDTLVLSKTWEPYDQVSWQEAFKYLCGGEDGTKKVEVIEYHEDRKVHSGSNDSLKEWRVPSVIRFIDAMTPEIKVVKFSRENIVVACTSCNQRKGGKTPNEAGMRLLAIPRKPEKNANRRRMVITWKKGMPEAWKNYMRDVSYWKTELENDN